jgi:hypothetical protein
MAPLFIFLMVVTINWVFTKDAGGQDHDRHRADATGVHRNPGRIGHRD